MATELFPIIATRDLSRALAFYRDLLGGRETYASPGPEGEPAYVALDIGTSHLGIGNDPEGVAPTAAVAPWIYTDGCDALVERMRAAGVPIVEKPRDEVWGERRASVQDPDGLVVHVAPRGTPPPGS